MVGAAIASTVSYTALSVLVWNLNLTAVWYCMIADNVCKAVVLMLGIRKEFRSDIK